MARGSRGGLIALGALGLALVVIAYLIVSGSSSYTIHAQFQNAGRLVDGGEVQIAGRKVGSITKIDLTPDGQADVELEIDESGLTPLHSGTRVAIRQVGVATLANNFVELQPGDPSAPELSDGAILSTDHTTGIVDLDAFLDAFDPSTRADIEGLVANGSKIFAGSGARFFNGMLAKFNPALAELNQTMGELGADGTQLAKFIDSAATASKAIAARREDLRSATRDTARGLNAIASQSTALDDFLKRAPALLDQARGTLADLGTASEELRPALREVPAAAKPLSPFLDRLGVMMRAADPALGQLDGQIPNLTASLDGFTRLRPLAVPALEETGKALASSRPILRGVRIYGSEFLLGILNGIVAVASGTFNKAGHYIHLEFAQPLEAFIGGPFGAALVTKPLIPGLIDLRTGITDRCPGGNAPPAPDGSSPYIPDKSLCNPDDSMPPTVNTP